MSFDPDAQDYIGRVLAVDGFMWPRVQEAVNRFVIGCKSDESPMVGVSNWDAIKACCLLAGAQTLAGALVPLRGATPTNVGFVADDYDPAAGLLGDGSKYLWANRGNNEDPKDNNHNAAFSTAGGGGFIMAINHGAGSNNLGANILRNRSTTLVNVSTNGAGLLGTSRYSPDFFVSRLSGVNASHSVPSDGLSVGNLMVFGRPNVSVKYVGKLSFYSIGEAVDLVSLDARVSQYMRDIAMPARRGYPLSRLVN